MKLFFFLFESLIHLFKYKYYRLLDLSFDLIGFLLGVLLFVSKNILGFQSSCLAYALVIYRKYIEFIRIKIKIYITQN